MPSFAKTKKSPFRFIKAAWHLTGILVGLTITLLGCAYLILWPSNEQGLV